MSRSPHSLRELFGQSLACARYVFLFCSLSLALSVSAATEDSHPDIKPFIEWLLSDGERLDNISFAEVVEAVSGCKVLPVDREDPVDRAMLELIESTLDAMLAELCNPEHAMHQIGRVNEISRPIEDFLLWRLDEAEGFSCTIPLNASGNPQRSGYPDLRLQHESSGRVFYIDPKVYKVGSEESSFRSFYFEPKKATNKILDDAAHVIVGVAHGGKLDGRWRLESWKLVDLIDFRVRLKAEFQASNRELYRDVTVLQQSKISGSETLNE